ncbi:14638_t:CDS:2, partial [Racocetra fulgida]
GGSEKHRFTANIIVIGAKSTNKHNTYGVYKACDEALGRDEALKTPITNKKYIVRNHLKRCEHFLATLGFKEAVDAYCNKTDNETENDSQASKKCHNTDISATLEFLNPNLILPDQYTLSNRILNAETTNLALSREKKIKLKETLIWDAIDISFKRERMIEVIPKIKSIIQNALNIGAKLSAIVSDSASAYAGAR